MILRLRSLCPRGPTHFRAIYDDGRTRLLSAPCETPSSLRFRPSSSDLRTIFEFAIQAMKPRLPSALPRKELCAARREVPVAALWTACPGLKPCQKLLVEGRLLCALRVSAITRHHCSAPAAPTETALPVRSKRVATEALQRATFVSDSAVAEFPECRDARVSRPSKKAVCWTQAPTRREVRRVGCTLNRKRARSCLEGSGRDRSETDLSSSFHSKAGGSATCFQRDGLGCETPMGEKRGISLTSPASSYQRCEEAREENGSEAAAGRTGTSRVSAPPETRPPRRELWLLAFAGGLPFFGFGFVDNCIMIVAGDAVSPTFEERSKRAAAPKAFTLRPSQGPSFSSSWSV